MANLAELCALPGYFTENPHPILSSDGVAITVAATPIAHSRALQSSACVRERKTAKISVIISLAPIVY